MPIIETKDGSHTIFSDSFGVAYHSTHGAITESKHIFINAGLRYKAALQREIHILETGFGTGLNAILTLLEAEKRNLTIHYTALEIFPLTLQEVMALNYPEQLGIPEQAEMFYSLHKTGWEQKQAFSEYFFFEKRKTPIEFVSFEQNFDLIFFDAFAPQVQPELWNESVMERMYKALKPDGALVTYCAQGEFKRNLKKAGFTVERLQGPPGKREMTRACREKEF